jgi:hypothetical protein
MQWSVTAKKIEIFYQLLSRASVIKLIRSIYD